MLNKFQFKNTLTSTRIAFTCRLSHHFLYACPLTAVFTKILKIIVFLFGSIKISRIFVKEITTKTKEKMETIYNETLNATKKYNTEKRMWQYVTEKNEVILTCKTEKGLDNNYKKLLNTLS